MLFPIGRRIRQAVAALIGDNRGRVPERRAAAGGQRPRARAAGPTEERKPRPSTSYWFLDLAGLIARAGPRPNRAVAIIALVARRAIERRLEPEESYVSLHNRIFILALSRAPPQQAAQFCADLAIEIERALVGKDVAGTNLVRYGPLRPQPTDEAQPGKQRPSSAAGERAGSSASDSQDALLRALKDVFRASDGSLSGRAEGGADHDALSKDPVEDELYRVLSRDALSGTTRASSIYGESRTASMSSDGAVAPGWREETRLDPIDAPRRVSLQRTSDGNRLVTGKQLEGEPLQPALEYRRIWQPEKGVISAYLCSPSATGAEFEHAYVRDWACLQRVTTDLKTCVNAGRRILTILPVHFDNIGRTASRHEFIQALSGLPFELKRLIVVEIDGIPDGVPPARLMLLVAAMRAHCRSVLLKFGLEAVAVENLSGCGALAAGVDLRHYTGSEAEAFQRLQRFEAAARKSKLRVYATGLDTRSLLAAALALQFRYLEGEAIALPLKELSGVKAFSLLDVYDVPS